jgi:DNA primase
VYVRGSSPLHQSVEEFVSPTLLAAVLRARQSVELGSPLDGAGQVKAAVQCATRLKRTRLLQLNTELQYVLREAKDTDDVAAMQQLRNQLLAIHQQLRTIDSATHLQG